MGKHGRSNGQVVGVGEVEGHSIEIIEVSFSFGKRYIWRAIKEGKIVKQDEYHHETIAGAINGAIAHFHPDMKEIETSEPTEDDFRALNAALYCSGLMEEIDTLQDAVAMFTLMSSTMSTIDSVRERAMSDVMDIEDTLASSGGENISNIERLRKISEIFENQCLILRLITERTANVLSSFVEQFIS